MDIKAHFHWHPSRFDEQGNPLAPRIMGLAEFQKDLEEISVKNFVFDDKKHFRVIVLDTETTGIDEDDEIIELAMLDLFFELKTRKFMAVGLLTDELREPSRMAKRTLSPFIKELTGLTEEDLAGKSIDPVAVNNRLKTANVVLIHNAKFDRRMLDSFLQSDELNNVLFGCSYECIEWITGGKYLSGKQELLLMFHGALFHGHRANTDIMGLAWLIVKFDYIGLIIENLKIKYCHVEAVKSHISTKNHLKRFGFSWGGDDYKVWHKSLPLTDFTENKKEWTETVYGPSGSFKVTEMSPKQRFSDEFSKPKDPPKK